MATRRRKKSATPFNDLYLAPLRGKSRVKKVIVYDVESKQDDTQFAGFSRVFLVGAYDGDTYTPFRNLPIVRAMQVGWENEANAPGGCIDQFMRFVFEQENWSSSKAIIYAHNGGRFDAIFILTWLQMHTDEFIHEIVSVQGRAQIVKVWRNEKTLINVGLEGAVENETESSHEVGTTEKKKKKSRARSRKKPLSWTFSDSALLLQMTLDEAAKLFCATSQKDTSFNLNNHERDPDWERYNKIDCVVLYESLEQFQIRVHEMGGSMGMTAPSTAMQTFRRGFQKEHFLRHKHFKTCVDKSCLGCLHNWILRGYHGGRTEIFKTHVPHNVRYFDINSSYPTAMLEPMPVGDKMELDGMETWKLMEKMSKTHVGFIECTVEIPANCYIPPLPYVRHVTKSIKKLVFPCGKLSSVWNYDELQLLHDPLVNGRILSIVKSVWYRKKPVFVDFVNTLYKLRNQKLESYDPALSELAKLMMNSLYGKFAMKRERQKLISLEPGKCWPSGARPINGDHDHCGVWIVDHTIDAPYIIPQVSAHITSLARIRLWQGMANVIRQKGQLFYTDTDSLMCNVDIPTGDRLGEWKREHPGALLSGSFILPKMYLLTHVGDDPYVYKKKGKDISIAPGEAVSVKMKGVGRKAQTRENFDTIVSGGAVHFTRIAQHRTVLRKGLSSPRLIDAHKSLRTTYDKRTLLSDGATCSIVIDDVSGVDIKNSLEK